MISVSFHLVWPDLMTHGLGWLLLEIALQKHILSRLFHLVFSTRQADVGTVLLLHGMEDDWLGNRGSEGRGSQ